MFANHAETRRRRGTMLVVSAALHACGLLWLLTLRPPETPVEVDAPLATFDLPVIPPKVVIVPEPVVLEVGRRPRLRRVEEEEAWPRRAGCGAPSCLRPLIFRFPL